MILSFDTNQAYNTTNATKNSFVSAFTSHVCVLYQLPQLYFSAQKKYIYI